MKNVIIIKFGELYLRGDNKRIFINMLGNTIRDRLAGHEGAKLVRGPDRLFVEYDGDCGRDRLIAMLQTVPGIAKISPALRSADTSLINIEALALRLLSERGEKPRTFKVETRRYNKTYPLDSYGVSSEVGGYILDNLPGIKVDVHNPELTVNIELGDSVCIYTDSARGLGGLPYGSAGKAVALLSGGIDSPVACFQMIRRGVEVDGVYFHSPPYTSERARDKVTDLAKKLAVFSGSFRLRVVNFTQIQTLLRERVPENRLTLLMKRSMLRIAEHIALGSRAHCLITGDSVGQVASQTLQALAALESAATLPILRPLAGMDKQEIVDIARSIATYDISIRPYEDCCTLFVPRHPETKPKREIIEKLERNVDGLDTLTAEAAERAETEVIARG